MLFNIIKKHTTSAFLLQNLSELLEIWHLPTLASTKKAIWRNLLSIQNEAISLVAVHSKEFWLVQKSHATVKFDSNGFSTNENLQRKQKELRNLQILKKMLEKTKSVLSSEQRYWAKKLGCCLAYCRSWKNTLWKHAVMVNTAGHLIRVLNKRSVSDGANLCLLWLVILK